MIAKVLYKSISLSTKSKALFRSMNVANTIALFRMILFREKYDPRTTCFVPPPEYNFLLNAVLYVNSEAKYTVYLCTTEGLYPFNSWGHSDPTMDLSE